MLGSAFKRGAGELEIAARKTAYDEAVVRYNTKMPGDLLRMRAGISGSHISGITGNTWSRTHYEKYIDALVDGNALVELNERHSSSTSPLPGPFGIMDDCLTKASDLYFGDKSRTSVLSIGYILGCRFDKAKLVSIVCFEQVAEAIYGAVNEIGTTSVGLSDKNVIAVCHVP